MKNFILIIFLSIAFLCPAQINFGWTAGLSFSFGNKVNRMGLRSNIYLGYEFVQVNGQVNLLYNFQTLALKNSTPEIQFGAGSQFCFGETDTIRNAFLGLTENNLPYFYSFGYTYLHYWDKQETSQGGGILNLNIREFSFATQNDLFGWGQGWRDRFRTGAFMFQYRYNYTKIGLKAEFWTGDYTGCTKVLDDRNYPARYGYKLNDKGQYTKFTAGLISLQVDQIIPDVNIQQVARVNIGVDSEKFRHAIQNKLMHDMPFFPDAFIKNKQLHYPMVDKSGNQYLFKDKQTIKPTTFYFNVGLNEFVFY
ncbi:MAG: polymorphic toxin type 23 domain-containing protein [Putridiphycobacter sp.]